MWALVRKLGLIGAIFFAANALAAIVSLFILFVCGRNDVVVTCSARCPVCGAIAARTAKYCGSCGSRL